MRAWYDILQFGGGPEDAAGIRASQKILDEMIAAEKQRGMSKIVLAGFSQGGAIVLQAALRHPERLAGLPFRVPRSARPGSRRARESRPADFMAQGQYDDISAAPRRAVERFSEDGYPLEWKTYPMPHSVCPEELEDLSRFLLRIL